MFEYNICNQFNENIYEKQCKALETNIPSLKKKGLLIDVDGSKIQEYELKGFKIKVYNSHYLNQVYIRSEIELKKFFQNIND